MKNLAQFQSEDLQNEMHDDSTYSSSGVGPPDGDSDHLQVDKPDAAKTKKIAKNKLIMRNYFLPRENGHRQDDPSQFDMPGTEQRDDDDQNNTIHNDDPPSKAPE